MLSTSSTRLRYNEKFMTSIYGVEKMLAYPHEKSDEIDTMLKKFLVTKSLNMIRRYLDCGNTDSVIDVYKRQASGERGSIRAQIR